MRPVEPGAGWQSHRAAVEARLHAVAGNAAALVFFLPDLLHLDGDDVAYLDGELCGVGPDGITSFSIIQLASDSRSPLGELRLSATRPAVLTGRVAQTIDHVVDGLHKAKLPEV
jgi:hypothetical protein